MTNYHSLLFLFIISSHICSRQWKLPTGSMYTKRAKDVTPQIVLPEYPRPQMVRADRLYLNGLRDYAIPEKVTKMQLCNIKFDGKILVPFPVASAVSGVKKEILN